MKKNAKLKCWPLNSVLSSGWLKLSQTLSHKLIYMGNLRDKRVIQRPLTRMCEECLKFKFPVVDARSQAVEDNGCKDWLVLMNSV